MQTTTANNQKVYDRTFWLSYVANLLLVTSNATTFRFAEFVQVFGGTEQLAGFIVSCGVFAALFGRLFLGQAIDRFGVRRLWLLVILVFVCGCVILSQSHAIRISLYAGRIMFAVGLSGMFTCSIFHAQNRAPVQRRTEVIGNLGSSGFLGMICGSQLCDFLGRRFSGTTEPLVVFGVVAGLGTAYLLLVTIITSNDQHHRPLATPAAHRLIFRHWPGPVAFVALLMGMNFIIPSVFLTRFSTYRGLEGIGTYWTCFAVAAFLIRMCSRRWSQTIGRHRMILMGTAGTALGFAILPSVTDVWQLVFPAVCTGFGHALLFPAVVSLGTEAFPREYRGTGTTLILGFFDLGGALSAPVLGWIIDSFNGGAGFHQMFYTSSALTILVSVGYVLTGARRPDSDLQPIAAQALESENQGIDSANDDADNNQSESLLSHSTTVD